MRDGFAGLTNTKKHFVFFPNGRKANAPCVLPTEYKCRQNWIKNGRKTIFEISSQTSWDKKYRIFSSLSTQREFHTLLREKTAIKYCYGAKNLSNPTHVSTYRIAKRSRSFCTLDANCGWSQVETKQWMRKDGIYLTWRNILIYVATIRISECCNYVETNDGYYDFSVWIAFSTSLSGRYRHLLLLCLGKHWKFELVLAFFWDAVATMKRERCSFLTISNDYMSHGFSQKTLAKCLMQRMQLSDWWAHKMLPSWNPPSTSVGCWHDFYRVSQE